jgi:polysaccharide export outer membrane protein
VEPPDIILLDAVKTIPKPPYRVEPLDVLFVLLENPLPNEPVAGPYGVDADGSLNLGPVYGGPVSVVGLTLPEVKKRVELHLQDQVKLKKPEITVRLIQSRAAQRVGGPHLVRQDGTIGLGTYGSVRVSGMTLAEVREAVEAQLSLFLVNPQVTVDIGGYNSKLFYVIYDGAGVGQTVSRLPITGNETVLDAIAQVSGLTGVSSKQRIWIARPSPVGAEHQILPVNWRAISECGDVATNYQLMPGDRLFVAAYPAVTLNNTMSRLIAPVQNLFGAVLLGQSTVTTLAQPIGATTTTTTTTR